MNTDDIEPMLIDCMKREKKLNEWEIQFLESISKMFYKKGDLTNLQKDKLEKIWDRITEL